MIYLLYGIIAAELVLVGACITLFMLTFDKPKKSNRQRIEELEEEIKQLKK